MFDINKSLGHNSHFFMNVLVKIVYLPFTTGIFPEFCKIAKVFLYFGLVNKNNEEKVMLAGSNLEVVDKFCYLGDMLDAGGSAESSTVTRVSGWKKFRELLPLLTTKANSLKGELYAACVRSVMFYVRETWPIKVEESQRLHRNEMSMIRWMCGVTMRDRYPCEEL